MTLRLAIPALAAAALIAGCGSSKPTTVTQVQTVQAPPTDTTTVPNLDLPTDTTPTTTTTQTPPQQQAPQGQGGTRAEAVAKVRAQGYRVDDPSSYHSADTLRVLVGTKADSGDGYAKRAFFFVGPRYIGTDTSDDSAQIRVEGAAGSTVTIAYAIYGKNDALCCPGGKATVRYEWNGSRLVPLDPIPPTSRRG